MCFAAPSYSSNYKKAPSDGHIDPEGHECGLQNAKIGKGAGFGNEAQVAPLL